MLSNGEVVNRSHHFSTFYDPEDPLHREFNVGANDVWWWDEDSEHGPYPLREAQPWARVTLSAVMFRSDSFDQCGGVRAEEHGKPALRVVDGVYVIGPLPGAYNSFNRLAGALIKAWDAGVLSHTEYFERKFMLGAMPMEQQRALWQDTLHLSADELLPVLLAELDKGPVWTCPSTQEFCFPGSGPSPFTGPYDWLRICWNPGWPFGDGAWNGVCG